MERRKFLSMLGLGGAGVLLSPSAAFGDKRKFEDASAAPFAVLHDTTLCIGCRKCEAGCARVNSLPVPEKPFDDLSVLEETRPLSVQSWTTVNKYAFTPERGEQRFIFRKQQCNHCLEPACVSACFVGAMRKSPDGPVSYDPKLCVGCRYCMLACPYYVPAYSYNEALNPLVYKCTLCAPRIRQGLLPGCVEDCPKGALLFGRRDELLRFALDRLRNNPGVYTEHVYGEHEMGGSSWLYINAAPAALLGLPRLDRRPAPDLTAYMTGMACMAAGMLPFLFSGLRALGAAGRGSENSCKGDGI